MNDGESQLTMGTLASSPKSEIANNGASKDADEKPGWLDQIKRLVGLGRNGTLRENLENELSREEGDMNADFSPEERMLIGNILKFREVRVEKVMIPRADIDSAQIDMSLGELIEIFRKSGHSRMPVFSDNLDDPKGMVHIKDVMDYLIECSQKSIASEKKEDATQLFEIGEVNLSGSIPVDRIVRPVLFIPGSMKATDLLQKMQATRTQMALVIDEYGGTDGLVSLEDIVELVFGDIADEHDEENEPEITSKDKNIWSADARVTLEDARKILGDEFNADGIWSEVDTLGGLMFTIEERVPVRGEVITDKKLPRFEFTINDADQRRIKSILIKKRRLDPRGGESRRQKMLADEEKLK